MRSFATPKGDASVVYCDDDVIVISKPAGILSEGAEGSAEKSILDYMIAAVGGPVYPVHRLDRSTSGIMLAARNKNAASALSGLISSGSMHKDYLAAALGRTPHSGRLEDDLFFDRQSKKAYVVKNCGRRGVKHAVLEYEAIAYGDAGDFVCKGGAGRNISLLRVHLITGRTHQIRVQLANVGHPLIGDRRYGGGNIRCTSALLSEKIEFIPEAVLNGYFGNRPFGMYLENCEFAMKIAVPDEFPWNILDIQRETP